MSARRIALATSLGIAASIAACVGDSPDANTEPVDASTPNQDANVPSETGTDATSADAVADASTPPCDPKGAFGPPVEVGGVNMSGSIDDAHPTLTDDELTVYFHSNRSTKYRIHKATRSRIGEPFTSVGLVTFGGDAELFSPSITADGLHMYLSRNRESQAEHDLAYAKFFGGEWQPVVEIVGDVNTHEAGIAIQHEADPFVLHDGSAIYFIAEVAPNQFQIHRAPCAAPGQCTGRKSVPEVAIQRGYGSTWPVLTRDELTMFFAVPPEGDGFKTDIYTATRAAKSEDFGQPARAYGSVGFDEQPSWISKDGCRLYYTTNEFGGGGDIYMVERAK